MKLLLGIGVALLAVAAGVLCIISALGEQLLTALLSGVAAVVALAGAAKAISPYVWGIIRSREDF